MSSEGMKQASVAGAQPTVSSDLAEQFGSLRASLRKLDEQLRNAEEGAKQVAAENGHMRNLLRNRLGILSGDALPNLAWQTASSSGGNAGSSVPVQRHAPAVKAAVAPAGAPHASERKASFSDQLPPSPRAAQPSPPQARSTSPPQTVPPRAGASGSVRARCGSEEAPGCGSRGLSSKGPNRFSARRGGSVRDKFVSFLGTAAMPALARAHDARHEAHAHDAPTNHRNSGGSSLGRCSLSSIWTGSFESQEEELRGWFNRIDRQQFGYIPFTRVLEMVQRKRATDLQEPGRGGNARNARRSAQMDEEGFRTAITNMNKLVVQQSRPPKIGRGSFRIHDIQTFQSLVGEVVELESAVSFDLFAQLILWDPFQNLDIDSIAPALELREAFILESVDQMIIEYSHLKLPPAESVPHPLWQRILEPCVGAMIVLNAVAMGVNVDTPSWEGWLPVEVFFTIFFVVEIMIKIKLEGFMDFWKGRDWTWNWFDVAVVAVAVMDLVLSRMVERRGAFKNMTMFRVARLARLTRMMRLLRLLRLKIFKELALMVRGVLAGLRTLLWAFVLLVFVTYALGVTLRQTVGEDRIQVSDEFGTVLFGSMPWSMFVVFRCFTSDCNLPNGMPLAALLYEKYGVMFFIPYTMIVVFVIFGIFNLIAATFVENVMEAARQKRQMTSEEEGYRVFYRIKQLILRFGGKRALKCPVASRETVAKKRSDRLVSLLSNTLPGGSFISSHESVQNEIVNVHFQCGGKITREMFNDVLLEPDVKTLLEDLEVHVGDRSELFDVIDANGDGEVDVSELVLGILKLRSGGADKSDMVATILGIRAIQRMVSAVTDITALQQEELQELRKEIGGNRGSLPPPLPGGSDACSVMGRPARLTLLQDAAAAELRRVTMSPPAPPLSPDEDGQFSSVRV